MSTHSPRTNSWVVFDLGGVLIRIHHSWKAAVAANVTVAAAQDTTPHPALDIQHHHAREFGKLVSDQQCGLLSHDDFCKRMSELTTGLVSPANVSRIHASIIVGVYEGVEQLLHDLHMQGVSTACLSNTNQHHWEIMSHIPAFAAIQHRHASHVFQLEKPNPAIFQAFERATQARPMDILYFDDLAPNIHVAIQVGWRAILIDPQSETVPQIRRALVTHGVLP